VKAWWNQLQPRQQVLLAAAGVVLVAVFLFTMVWEPLAEAREQERNRVAQQQALADWLEAVEPIARSLREERARRPGDLADRSLLGRVDETARAAGLAGAIQRIEPGGDDRVRVWLEEADFPTLMEWLSDSATEQGIFVEQFTAERADSPGTSNVRMTLISES